MRMHLLVTAAALLASSLAAHADVIVLSSASGGVYNYSIPNPSGQDVPFVVGNSFTFQGLSGVTGASATGALGLCFSPTAVTSTSVVFTAGGTCNYVGFNFLSTFVINSTVLTQGTASYLSTSTSVTSSTVSGPVAAAAVVTPEPASFLMLGTGLLGLSGAIRRRVLRSDS